MPKLFLDIFNISAAASWLIAAAVLVRFLLKNRAPKWTLCLLWAIVGIRLVIPFSFESDFSLLPSRQAINTEAVYFETAAIDELSNSNINGETESTPKMPSIIQKTPAKYIDSGIDAVDTRVNTAIAETVSQTPSETENPLKKATDIAAIIWLFGIAAMAFYGIVNYILLKKRIGAFITDGNGIRRSEAVGSPFILGMLRPKIYLPFGLSDETEAHIIAHEMAHLKRKDYLIKPLGYAILTVHWFNPLVWVAYILLCRDIEMACDEKVVKNMSAEGRKAYASSLLECGIKRTSIAACPVAFGEIGVKQRVKNAINYKKPIFWIIIIAIIACIAVAVFFLTTPPEDSDSSEPMQGENGNSEAKSIEFSQLLFNSQLTDDAAIFPEKTKVFPIYTLEEFQNITAGATDKNLLQFAKSINDETFADNMLILSYFWTQSVTEIQAAEVTVQDKNVTVDIIYELPVDAQKMNIYPKVMIIRIRKADVEGCETFVTKQTELAKRYAADEADKIEFVQYSFGGVHTEHSSLSTPSTIPATKITSQAELFTFLASYEYDGIGKDLTKTANSIPADYFSNKALVFIPYNLPLDTKIDNVYSDEDYLMVQATLNYSDSLTTESATGIFAVEISKTDIYDTAKVKCFLKANFNTSNENNAFADPNANAVKTEIITVNGSFSGEYIPTDGSLTGEYIPPEIASFAVVDSESALEKLFDIYIYNGNEYSLRDFTQTLSEDYFEKKLFVAISALKRGNAQFGITAYECDGVLSYIKVNVTEANDKIDQTEEIVFLVEIEKLPVAERFSIIVEPEDMSETDKEQINIPAAVYNIAYNSYWAERDADFSLLYDESGLFSNDSKPYLIDTEDKLAAFMDTYASSHPEDDSWGSLNSFADSLTEEFFRDNALIITYFLTPSVPTSAAITNIYSAEGCVYIEIAYDNYGNFDAIGENLLVAEVKKADISNCTSFKTKINNLTNMYFYQDVLNNYQAMAEYLFTEDYEKHIDDERFAYLGNNAELQYRWDSMKSAAMNDVLSNENLQFGYALKDLNGDNAPELLLLSNDYCIRAIFTQSGLSDAFWNRYTAKLTSSNEILTFGSNGASNTVYELKRLNLYNQWETIITLGSDTHENGEALYYQEIGNDRTVISGEEFSKKVSEYLSAAQNNSELIYFPVDYMPFE